MILDIAMGMMEKLINEIKEAEPSQREQFIKNASTLIDIATETMKESPELRQGFAKIHSEFLNHPESKETIRKCIEAYKQYTEEETLI